jgi:Polyketide cyclase / dehydrase and lipid transport
MRLHLASLWRQDSTIDRLPYFATGVFLVGVKQVLDWLIATHLFHRSWNVFNYVVLPPQTVGVLLLPEQDRLFYGTLLVTALPFIVVGVLLTVQRLRAAQLPVALVLFFFMPLVNVVLLLTLCVIPSRRKPAPEFPEDTDDFRPVPLPADNPYRNAHFENRHSESWRRLRDAHRRITADTTVGSGALALGVVVPTTLALVILSTMVLKDYGWGLFVGLPFCAGMASVVLFGLVRPQGFGACMMICFLATTLAGAGMLVFALEGAICLLMAAPIGYFLAFLGGVVGYAIQLRPWSLEHNPLVLIVLVVTLPSLMAAESAASVEPEVFQVCSVVEIDAPPDRVWEKVISFPELPEPDDWVFRTGVAYPIRAEINGSGPGAERHCVFSTGAFIEPIDVWDEPHRLAFRVAAQPEPMREWSPYTIHPPHLHGYMVSRRGEFRLTALDEGRTRLEGTTWYTNRMWPAFYWRLWSDAIIHRIHLRVLNHIKGLAEAAPEAADGK